MKLPKILNLLRQEPLLCSNDYRATLLEIFEQHANLSREEFQAKRTGRGSSGSELCVEQMEMRQGVAIIPIGGPIGMGLGEFEKGAGAVDVDDIRSELDLAMADDDCTAIILNFDSPGGMVTGTPELAEHISNLGKEGLDDGATRQKPIYAFCRGQMCSAAYYLAAGCDGIFCTASAQIGNIGVYTVFHDLSQLAAQKGIAVKVISSGPLKATGVPGTSLSADQEIFLRESIQQCAEAFYKHVRATRSGLSDADITSGGFYRGEQAQAKGFVDGLMGSIDDLVEFLK